MNLPAEQRLLTRVFVLAWLSHFFHCIATNAYVHLPGFLKGLGASELQIGTLSGATAALAILLRPALGSTIGRVGYRPFIVGAGAAHMVLCALYCTIDHLGPAIYVLRAVHGLVEAVIFSILFAYAAEIVPARRRTEGIAWFGVSGQIPIAIGGLAGDAILARSGYPALFLGTIGCAALGLALSLALGEARRPPVTEPSRGLVACASQRDLVPLWFIGVAFATAIAPLFIFLKTFVMQSGVGSVGLFLACYSLSAAALRLSFGWVPDRVGPKRVLGPAILAVGGGLWLVSRASSGTDLAFAGALAGAGHGLAFPILAGLVVDRALPAERPIAVSLVTSIFDVGALVGGPLFGAVIEARGYSAAFGSAAVIAVAGLAAFTVWDRAVADR